MNYFFVCQHGVLLGNTSDKRPNNTQEAMMMLKLEYCTDSAFTHKPPVRNRDLRNININKDKKNTMDE